MPVFVEPALAEPADGPPTGKGWVHEIKQDGYRMQARIDGGKIKLLTRTGLDWTKRFPTVAKALEQLPVSSALIDGEIVAQEESGISTFSALQSDLRDGRRDRLGYFLFDLLYCEGVNLTGVALKDRKEALEELCQSIPDASLLRYSQHMDDGDARTIFQHACQMGLEGLISKRADAPYRSGRTTTWIKSKCTLSEDLIIIGYVPSSTSRQAVGSLVLGFYDGTQLIHAGRAGTGFSDEIALALRSGLAAIETERPKFNRPIERESLEGVRWVEPRIVADIQFRGWSPDKVLRQAAFKGIREDKEPEDVVLHEPWNQTAARGKEVPRRCQAHPSGSHSVARGRHNQAGLAEFYADIADWILPHVTGRVLSLVRCPGGVGKSCFYAKHIWEGAGKALQPVDVGESGADDGHPRSRRSACSGSGQCAGNPSLGIARRQAREAGPHDLRPRSGRGRAVGGRHRRRGRGQGSAQGAGARELRQDDRRQGTSCGEPDPAASGVGQGQGLHQDIRRSDGGGYLRNIWR